MRAGVVLEGYAKGQGSGLSTSVNRDLLVLGGVEHGLQATLSVTMTPAVPQGEEATQFATYLVEDFPFEIVSEIRTSP